MIDFLNSLEFTYRGCVLDDDHKSLSDYEIRDDSEIHVFEKVIPNNSPITYTDEELRKVSWEINLLARVHNFHSIAHVSYGVPSFRIFLPKIL